MKHIKNIKTDDAKQLAQLIKCLESSADMIKYAATECEEVKIAEKCYEQILLYLRGEYLNYKQTYKKCEKHSIQYLTDYNGNKIVVETKLSDKLLSWKQECANRIHNKWGFSGQSNQPTKEIKTQDIEKLTKKTFLIELAYEKSSLYKQLQNARNELNKLNFYQAPNTSKPILKTHSEKSAKDLNTTINNVIDKVKNFDNLIIKLVENVQTLIGEPPCSFSVGAMGSLGKQIFCLYSDFEFVIILGPKINDDNTTKFETLLSSGYITSYFRFFVTLLKYLFISFGESRKTENNPYSKFGFCIDDRNSPFSEAEGYFISTVDMETKNSQGLNNVATLFENVFSNKIDVMPLFLLMDSRCIYGDESLLSTFKDTLNQNLNKKITVNGFALAAANLKECEDDKNGRYLRHYAVFQLYKNLFRHEYNQEFSKQFYSNTEKSHSVLERNIKIILEAIPLVVKMLSMYCNYGVLETNIFEKLEVLVQEKQINEDLAYFFKSALLILYQLRIKTHQHYKTQNEIIKFHHQNGKNDDFPFSRETRIDLFILATCIIDPAHKGYKLFY